MYCSKLKTCFSSGILRKFCNIFFRSTNPVNILVRKGIIVGVIDWGDITSGDVATDLASLWMLFESNNARQRAIAEYQNISVPTLHRAKGWAVYFAVTLLDVGLVDNFKYAAVEKRTISWVARDKFSIT